MNWPTFGENFQKMYKDQLLFSLEREIQLLKKMAPMIEAKDLDFRPGEKVRSSVELMRYLSYIGGTMLRWFVKDDLNAEVWAGIRAHAGNVTIENFPDYLDQQLADIRSYMAEVTEEDLLNKEVSLPTKEKMMLGAAIINAPIKWLAVYRMQLFVNLKLNGRPELGTRDAWYAN
jgi:hypothetical protein